MPIVVMIICNMILNVAMVAGVVYSAVYFNKPVMLWFLLLPFLNGLSYKSGGSDKDNKDASDGT